MRWVIALSRALVLGLAGVCGHAATFTTTTTLDRVDAAPGDGVCADASGACSLRAAIQESNALPGADQIVLGDGNFVLTLSGDRDNTGATGDLDVATLIRISGTGVDSSVIDGGTLDRVFDVAAGGLLQLGGLTVSGGVQQHFDVNDQTESSGGGLLVRAGGSAELDHVDVRSNRSLRKGAGIGVFGSLQGRRLRIIDNAADVSFSVGGGIYVGATASLLDLDECELSGNTASQGGAVYSDGEHPVTSIQHCLITANQALSGGAIQANLGSTRWLLRNVTISGNQGGAIFADSAHQLRLEHCTITGNHSNSQNGGGAIFDVRGSSSGSFIAIELINTIVLGNTQPAGNECSTVFPDVIVSGGATLHAPGNACRMRPGAGDIATADAGLAPLADNGGTTRSHALVAGSVAIDAATAGACASDDQRGQPRPCDGNGDGVALCDIGAVEESDRLLLSGFE